MFQSFEKVSVSEKYTKPDEMLKRRNSVYNLYMLWESWDVKERLIVVVYGKR